MLAEFWTTVAWNAASGCNRLLPAPWRAQLARRTYAEAPAKLVKCISWRELVRLGVRSSFLGKLLCSGERSFSVIGIYRHFDGHVARHLKRIDVHAVYAYEGGALQTFREAKKRGITTIYEQPSSYWYWVRNLLSEEAARNPEFAGLLPNLRDSRRHLEWKDEELRLADYVFVPSEHVRRTLAGAVPDEKIRVISYGAPEVRERKRLPLDPSQPLKVLFVGALSQHKGIGYLLNAVQNLGDQVKLTLVGRRFGTNARVDEACNRWQWFETVPHQQILDVMMQSDVLVLPSLGEGFGLVVTEALAAGLPVVITPNVGAADLICHGREGFIVPTSSAEAIATHLSALYHNRELLIEMSHQAQATAAERSWNVYRDNWAEAVRAVCSE